MNPIPRQLTAISLMLAAASASLLGLVSPAVAAASPNHFSINTGKGWSAQPTGPLFDFVGLGPGWTSTSALAVRNDSDEASALTFRASDIVDDENGCNRPESLVDMTCSGNDAGELGREMVFTVYSQGNPQVPMWRGNLYDLTAGAKLDSSVAPNQIDSFSIVAELPYSSGNETQTDSVSFDLVVGLDGATVAVEGTKTTRPPTSNPVTRAIDQLPFTGTPAQRLVAAALTMLLIGTVLVLLLRRPRMRPESV